MSRPSRHQFMKRTPLLAACVIASLAACESAKQEGAEPPKATASALTISAAQFQQLRWLEGGWRGSGGGIDAFFEGYHWVDDSTIKSFNYADSTLAVLTDSGEITLRGGVVRSGSPTSSYVVSGLDSTSVKFSPERNARNSFEWRHTGPGAWTARLTWDSAGVPKERIYEMRAQAAAGAKK